MKTETVLTSRLLSCLHASVLAVLACLTIPNDAVRADEENQERTQSNQATRWQQEAVEFARIMSHVQWSPVAQGMPKRKGFFEQGKRYTGVPYSSVKWVGRYIGFDIYLKTFLAAVENPESVLYTENLEGRVSNAECYYGKVCSSYTSYALQCGIWYLSRLHAPPYREGAVVVEDQSAQSTRVGDLIFTPPKSIPGGSHIEIVTGVTRDDQGTVTHVRVEESRPPTTMNTNRTAADFDSHLASKNRMLCRITDFDAWRGGNRADRFLFPNYAEDSATPTINRVLLLDRGDWVPYSKGQVVKFNLMDRDKKGIRSLVIKRGGVLVEEIPKVKGGVIERSFEICGDYTAHCILQDGSISQACEFSVCDLKLTLPTQAVSLGQSWQLGFLSDNMKVIMVYFRSNQNSYAQGMIYPTDEDRANGKVKVPADLLTDKGKSQAWLIGENRYGRLKVRKEFVIE
tara:strand:- start:1124810 stop:1126180 length:1371 start_codon:yes stop_codon:yes gene_type:complete